MSKRAYDAILDWEKSTGAMYIGGPFFARFFDEKQFVTLEIKNSSQGIRLSLIKTPPEFRGQGLASRALKELLQFADKHGVPVNGSVDPQEDDEGTQGKPILNKANLKKWYGRHGFKNKPHDEIVRPPAAARVVEALLEMDDPKDFIDDMHTLDLRTLKQEIETAIPGLVVAGIHVLKGMLRNEGENHEFYIYLAREPRSQDAYDPQNYPPVDEQRRADQIIVTWLDSQGCQVLEKRMIDSSAMYKSVSRCLLSKYIFRTAPNVVLKGHSNDEPLNDVRVRRGL